MPDQRRGGRDDGASTARRHAFLTGVVQAVAGGLLLYFAPSTAAPGVVSARTITTAVLWSLASAFLLTSIFAPRTAARLYGFWTTLARAIGVLFTVLAFSVVFVVFLPLFLFVRLRDPLRKRLGAASYWEPGASDDHSLDRALRPY